MKTLKLLASVLLSVLWLSACDAGSDIAAPEDAGTQPDLGSVDIVIPMDEGVNLPDEMADETEPGCESDEACVETLSALGVPDGPCRTARCGTDGICFWEFSSDGSACDDDDSCTEDTVCDQGACLGRYVCQACEATDDCASLEDGNRCNGTLHCVNERCEVDPGTVVTCPAPTTPCTVAFCAPDTGVCDEMNAPDGTSCDDEDFCTVDDQCSEGTCAGVVRICDDDNACTSDACTQEDGCVYLPVSCDDDDACTVDYCDPQTGCVWDTRSCNDGNVCTVDSCDATSGCQHAVVDCDDANACTADTCRPGSGCGHREILCDDGDPLTEDSCDAGTGQCINALPGCDDGDPCTVDSWDSAAGECQSWTRSCNDGDPCTVDSCDSETGCVHDAFDCDDDDPCTGDSCTPYVGCAYAPLSVGSCDDGRECSTSDTCVDGVCLGDDSACVCPAPNGPAVRITYLQVGTDGQPGSGLDLDGDPATCAPANSCSGGIDNAFAAVASLANAEITSAIENGSIHLLIQHQGFRADGQSYVLNGWLAEPNEETCDHMTERCAYWLDPRTFDDDCNASARIGEASFDAGQLSAGGPGYLFRIEFPLMAGVDLAIVLHDARIEGTMTLGDDTLPATMSGILAGAIRKDDLRETILAVPPEEFPISVDIILNAVDLLLIADIDTDGDGVDDAVSAGLPIEGIAADILGTLGE